jgi:hypothetical protein
MTTIHFAGKEYLLSPATPSYQPVASRASQTLIVITLRVPTHASYKKLI